MGIYKRKGTDFWHLRYRAADGKLVRRSSGTKDRGEAEAILAEAEAEVAAQKRSKLEQAVTGAKPMAKPPRFSWRRWTTDVVRWHRDIPQSRYGRLLARKTERPEVTALGEIIASAQVADREAAVAAAHILLVHRSRQKIQPSLATRNPLPRFQRCQASKMVNLLNASVH
jgi:hypothetical protein